MRQESGQSLLIAVLITSMLFLAVPVIVYLTINRAHHRMGALKRDQATATAELGIEYAKQVLTNPAIWVRPLAAGNLPAACNTNDIVGADGSHFRLTCNVPGVACPTCEPYQIKVRATAYMPMADGTIGGDPSRPVPYGAVRAIEVYFSQKTLAAVLPNGMVAPAALELAFPPSAGPGSLYVYNGPIVNHDPIAASWDLNTHADLCREPRKFSAGPIQGVTWDQVSAANPTYPRSGLSQTPLTDRKEFWANADVGFPSVIDVTSVGNPSYIWGAKNASCTGSDIPQCGVGACIATPASSCYFDNAASGLPAIFDVAGNVAPGNYVNKGFTFTDHSANGVIFVTGDAIFRHVTIDASPLGGVIVIGNATLEDNRDALGPYGIGVSSHPSCDLDTPYGFPNVTAAPLNYPVACPSSCQLTSFNYIDIKGFLYVGGNLIVNPGVGKWWGVHGAVRVDGNLTLTSGNLEIAYDANINRNVRTVNFELIKDRQLEVPVQ